MSLDATALPRRRFMSRLASVTAAAAALWTPSRAGGQERTEQRTRAVTTHDLDAWLDPLTGTHRQVYDIVSPAGTIGIAFARNFLNANRDGYGLTDRDISVVVSLRHSGIAYAFTDALWRSRGLGTVFGVTDAKGEMAPANPEAEHIVELQKRGVVFTVCGMALNKYARQQAAAAQLAPNASHAEWRAAILPGVVEVVAGVIAVNRTQERGFSYVYAG